MFGLSTWEMLIIVAVALIFIGPDQLPKVARQVGKGLRQVRGVADKVDGEVRRAVREATAEAEAEEEEELERQRAAAAKREPQPELANTTPEPPPSDKAPDHDARDWSQVGKGPVEGRVPTARPGRTLEVVPPPVDDTTKKDKPAA